MKIKYCYAFEGWRESINAADRYWPRKISNDTLILRSQRKLFVLKKMMSLRKGMFTTKLILWKILSGSRSMRTCS